MLLKLKETCKTDNLSVSKKIDGSLYEFKFNKSEFTEVPDEFGNGLHATYPDFYEKGKGEDKAGNEAVVTPISEQSGEFDVAKWIEKNLPLTKDNLSKLDKEQLFAVSKKIGLGIHPMTGQEKHITKILQHLAELEKANEVPEVTDSETPEEPEVTETENTEVPETTEEKPEE